MSLGLSFGGINSIVAMSKAIDALVFDLCIIVNAFPKEPNFKNP